MATTTTPPILETFNDVAEASTVASEPASRSESPTSESSSDTVTSLASSSSAGVFSTSTSTETPLNLPASPELASKPETDPDSGVKESLAEMKKENDLIEKELEEENKREELLHSANRGDSEQKYQQLRYLLEKSTTYTDYLFRRMEAQREKSRKKAEKREKKRAMILQEEREAAVAAEEKSGKKRKRIEDEEDSAAKRSKAEDGRPVVKEETVVDAEGGILPVVENLAQVVAGLRPDAFSRSVNGEKVSDLQPRLVSGGVLRDYQIKGFVWMKGLFENAINGILADEMGLGKTVQCISLVAHLVSQKCEGPFLIVAPLSTVPNWFSEFKRFTPLLPVMVHHGAKEARLAGARKIGKVRPVGPFFSRPVVITSYEMIIHDRRVIGRFPWKCIIVDEGHRIKNMNCRLIRELKLFDSCNRLLLTGTPLQNNLAELWSLLNFLLPDIFDDLNSFESWFDMSLVTDEGGQEAILRAERENNVLSMLHRILEPFLLRRLKSDVHLDIPPKREVLVYAPLTAEQRELYQSAVNRTIETLLKEKSGEAVGDCLAAEEEEEDVGRGRRQRKAKIDFNYAFFDSGEKQGKRMSLVKRRDEENREKTVAEKKGKNKEGKGKANGRKAKKEVEDDDKENDGDEKEDWYEQISRMTEAREKQRIELKEPKQKSTIGRLQMRNIMMLLRRVCNHPFLIEFPVAEMENPSEKVVNLCGKMMILDQMLVRLRVDGHKVLVFSQMTQMLDIIADYLDFRGFAHCRLDGSMQLDERHENIRAFNEDPNRFVFLLSTRAGGLGLNLMAADTVIIYDSDWNPQCDLQAQDRAHRLGQKKPVLVYRLITANTIDQRIVERAAAKRKLEKMVMRKGRFQEAGRKQDAASITSQELMSLLRSRDQDGEVVATEAQRTSGKVRWTMTDEELEKLIDRSDLYVKWEEETKARKVGKEKEGEKEEVKSELTEKVDHLESPNSKDGKKSIFSVVETVYGED